MAWIIGTFLPRNIKRVFQREALRAVLQSRSSFRLWEALMKEAKSHKKESCQNIFTKMLEERCNNLKVHTSWWFWQFSLPNSSLVMGKVNKTRSLLVQTVPPEQQTIGTGPMPGTASFFFVSRPFFSSVRLTRNPIPNFTERHTCYAEATTM